MNSLLRPTTCTGLLVAALGMATVAAAQAPAAGFYGGLSLRENGAEQGLAIGAVGNPDRFTFALDPSPGPRALVFGGYRWRNDLALEAALGSADSYRLSGRGGVGLMLPDATDPTARAWNVDVYGSWAFWRRFSLYGRLGYSQSETVPLYSTSVAASADRRVRDGLHYGVGLRYDVNRSLGLRLEYARIGTLAQDVGTTVLPEGDQVQFGLQFRF